MSDDILARVCNLVAEILNVPPAQVNAGTTQAELPAWNSLGHLNIMLSLEQEFGVSLDPEQVESMTSIAAIVGVLREHA
jgi:acyl carrier protein